MIVKGIERDYVVHDDMNIMGFYGKYYFLSNFHVAPIYMDGLKFPATENGYMYAKLDPRCKNDKWKIEIDGEEHSHESIIQLFQTLKPSKAKKLGSMIPLRPDWEDVKYDVMSAVVFDKYYRNINLRHQLLSTGDKYLEETNHWNDKVWGVCDGVGENWLGKISMNIRDFWADKYPELVGKPILF